MSINIKPICKALGNETRLRIILCLRKPQTVSQMLANCNLTQSALSQHLSILRLAGLVKARKQGREVIYSVPSAKVLSIANQIIKL